MQRVLREEEGGSKLRVFKPGVASSPLVDVFGIQMRGVVGLVPADCVAVSPFSMTCHLKSGKFILEGEFTLVSANGEVAV